MHQKKLDHLNQLVYLGHGEKLNSNNIKAVHKVFEKIAFSNPEDIAVSCGHEKITYKDLNIWANQIAKELLKQNIKIEDRIAILIEPSCAMIASILGVLKSGACYIPLDTKQSIENLDTLLINSQISIILIQKNLLCSQLRKLKYTIYEIDKFTKKHDNSTNICKESTSLLENTAYIIYTSGSTGLPKGVVIRHKELASSTLARHIVYPYKSNFLLLSQLSCDSSIAGIWGTLTSGGNLIVASYEENRDPEQILRLITKYAITQFLCIPSLYENILKLIEKSNADLNCLRTVILAGEKLHQTTVDKHFKLCKNIELVNEYGPTETTVWATYKRFTSSSSVSIGKPVPGANLYVLDDKLNFTPKGEKGELFIGGDHLAKGYFNRPNETSKSFLKNPFNKDSNAHMYKTGDMVSWNDDGTLNFIGRKDYQVKIRGYRVELEAVECLLRSFAEVENATVISNSENTSLIAFIIILNQHSLDELKQKLKLKLPSYMIPSEIYPLKYFPQTNNGKVNRLALASMVNKLRESTSIKPINLSQSKNNDINKNVEIAWSNVLKMNNISHEDNFFDLGGHSLMVFKLQETLEHYTNVKLTIISLFRHTTIKAQSELILQEVNTKKKSNNL